MENVQQQLQPVSEGLKWFEHRTKPIFVIVAIALYANSLVRLAIEVSPTKELDTFLTDALGNLFIPFSVILMQEMLELIANIGENNLLSARHQFEIVVLVIVRSFFKSFEKVSGYIEDGVFSEPVRQAVIKICAIILLMFLIFAFRRMAESKYLRTYVSGQTVNQYKQILVVILSLFVLGNMLFISGPFEETEFIRQIFTGIIIIDAMFLIIAIMRDSRFLTIAFESSLIIALVFARFPLFSSTSLSYALSVLGVGFATATLYIMYRVANVVQIEMVAAEDLANEAH
ncbi:MAG: hypothetical protein AAF490_25240 [Chloroflexota bacterium]